MPSLRTSILLSWIFLVLSAGAWEPRYWVWGRTSAITRDEAKLLRAQGVRRLYWHFVSLKTDRDRWVSDAVLYLAPALPEAPMRVPVFRLVPGRENALSAAAARDLATRMRATVDALAADEAQIDFDCPDRLLPAYADFLRECRDALKPRLLSATALGHWSGSTAFGKLQSSVDALYPMFYDLQADDPAHVRAEKFVPMLDRRSVEAQMAAWAACTIPWYAGLPGFARVTIFDARGNSRGHLRNWEWDALAFDSDLTTAPGAAAGLVRLLAQRNVIIAKTPLTTGESAVCRWPSLVDLSQAIHTAHGADASGIAVFRLPEGGAPGGWSLRQWSSLLEESAGAPELRVAYRDGALQLSNNTNADLPPRLSGSAGPMDRGWQLEIQDAAGRPIFHEAAAGDFAAVFGHVQPDGPAPQPVPIAAAERLTFWFSALPAGSERLSGLVSLAPDTDLAALRWRVPGAPGDGDWHPLELSVKVSTHSSSPP